MEEDHPDIKFEVGHAKRKSEFYYEGVDKPGALLWQKAENSKYTANKKKHNRKIMQICNFEEI